MRCFCLLVLFLPLALAAQKQMRISDSLAATADRFEARMKSGKALVSYPFDSFYVSSSYDTWETIVMHTLQLKPLRYESGPRRVSRTSFSFVFTNGKGDTAWVMGLPQDRRLPTFVIGGKGRYEEAIQTQQVFTAYIRTTADTTLWQLVTQETMNTWKGEPVKGYIANGQTEIRIEEIERMENGKKSLVPFLGAELYENGKSLGAVQFQSVLKPVVWLRRDLAPGKRFLLAAISETLLISQAEKYDESNIRQ
jgi:hypothetical protein